MSSTGGLTKLHLISICASLALLGALAPLVILEGSLRFEQWYRKGTPLLQNPRSRWDAQLGWVGREHVLGPTNVDVGVLAIGDSFTDGLTVPSDKMWFAHLGGEAPTRIIAYGGLGYGTYQELEVLKRYVGQGIHPRRVILQLCSNDVINNDFEVERLSFLQRAPGPRPYFEDERVVFRSPRALDAIFTPLIGISRFAHRYSVKWEMYVAAQAKNGVIDTVENQIQAQGFSFQPFRHALKITERLLQLFRDEVSIGFPGAKLVFLLVDDVEPYTTGLERIAKKLQVPFVTPVRGGKLSDDYRLEDRAHLNELGNKFVGEALAKALLSNATS